MKRMISLVVLILLALCGSAMAAEATAALDMNSAYVWRGITFNEGLVLQPSLDLTKGGLDINVWGNLDVDDYDDTLDSGEFSEVDLTASYGFKIQKLDIRVGLIQYLFPTTEKSGTPGTREIFASLAYPIVGGLSAGADIYYDIDQYDAFAYTDLKLSYAYKVNDKLGLEGGVSAGYAGEDYTADGDPGLFDYKIFVSASYTLTKAWSVGANLNYTDSLDKDKLPDQDTHFYGGANISYAF